MAEYILPIQRLVEEFRRIPGVGAKTAARYAFAVLNLSESDAARFADAIVGVKRDVYKCPICHGLSSSEDSCDIHTLAYILRKPLMKRCMNPRYAAALLLLPSPGSLCSLQDSPKNLRDISA